VGSSASAKLSTALDERRSPKCLISFGRENKMKKSAVTASSAASTAAVSTPSPNAGGVVLVQPPPDKDAVPVAPDGFTATNGAEYRGVLPKATQLAVLSGVVEELGRFSDYASVFGSTAPPLESILQSFGAANQWSLMRVRTIAWEAYCLQQEGLAWVDVRRLMNKLQPLFALASASDATLATRFPMMVKLFNAQRVIAQKGVVTRKANRKAIAEGKPPVKGKVGARRQRMAQKAALIAAEASVTAVSANGASPAPVAPGPVGTGAPHS
jgi:hypothetical protein